MTAPVFLAESLVGDEIVVDGAEGRHAAVVRRVRVGEQVDLTDGLGGMASCRVIATSKTGLTCAVESRRTETAPAPRLVIVQALAKGDRGELAVELLTEVGVDVIVPWAAARCVTRWQGERAAKSLARWRATAREAAKQSRRAWFPDVRDLVSTADVGGLLTAAALPVVLHEAAEVPMAGLIVPAVGDVVVVVGPEGGLTDDEVSAFDRAGGRALRLGPSVLRTSTAGVAAVAALLSRTPRWS
ncbi:MAG: 16S rRNA (uracil(1498)-N(3))-methyltransferase [Propionibacteriales bacterium]|nr:16S rRNA (uracil(1498)-N(3))-methyltransferase [Propionibacteriales bacterium]